MSDPSSLAPPELGHLPYAEAKKLAVRAFELRYLTSLLDRTGRNISRAARSAGMDRSNFRRLLKQYGVLRPGEDSAGAEGDPDGSALSR